ncbi:MAG: Mrr restriction system protein [Planctomycetes bacterium]|nr:Mrr restriction system protein [Planctomycetota bacterium]
MASEAHVLGRKRAGEYLHAALTALKEAGGELRGRQVISAAEKRLKLSDYERDTHEKSGYVRWESVVHFYSIECVKAGWLRKNKGVWYLTPEGEQALKLNPKDFLDLASKKYREWKSRQEENSEQPETPEEQAPESAAVALSRALDQAKEEIAEFVQAMSEYDFQDLVAALLRGMGYHTPFTAKKGAADGGVDVLAYSDPFGGKEPRFKVQVKHKEQPVGESTVRELLAVLSTQGDVGLLVSSSGFTQPATRLTQHAGKHIELVDVNRLIDLWDQYYDKLDETDKARLPLRRVSFLASQE